MNKILDSEFENNLKSVLDYILESEADNFMNEDDPEILNIHVYKKALVLYSCIGEEDIDRDTAIKLLETDLADSVYVGNESEGYVNLGDGDDITEGEECKLWIV